MSKNKSNDQVTLGVVDVVQIVFIILKLFNLIDWSWIVVLIPTWISLGVALILFIVYSLGKVCGFW